MPLPQDDHVWLSINDPEDSTSWLFDATFLRSDYRCIYGSGCASIDTEADPAEVLGCCVHGAHLVDDEDRENVLGAVAQLTSADWQFLERAEAKGGPLKAKKTGDWVTRKVDGACIFLNRAGFEGGAGCALHIGALRHGERPLDWKPDVCWQVPIRLDIHEDDYGHETVMVRAWERRDWGPGGEEFHWWCIEEDVAYGGGTPVYMTSRDELVELIGPEIYDRLVTMIEALPTETPVALTKR